MRAHIGLLFAREMMCYSNLILPPINQIHVNANPDTATLHAALADATFQVYPRMRSSVFPRVTWVIE